MVKPKDQQEAAAPKVGGTVLAAAAVLVAAAGVLAFTFLAEAHLGVRLACLFGGLAVGCGLGWLTPSGKQFISYCRASYEELRLVVWPTRRETLQSTGLVMAFVVIIAVFLLIVDKLIEWGLYDMLLTII